MISIQASKTKAQISNEYDINSKTLRRRLVRAGIELPPGNITPKYQKLIYETFGHPPKKMNRKMSESVQL